MSIIIQTPKGERSIGSGESCFVVAEMSANHNQNYDKAEEIIRTAAKAGADAIKLQTYTPDTITIDCDKEWFLVGGEENPEQWRKQTLYELYQTAYTPWEWHKPLQKLASELGLVFFSAPFDLTSVDFLEELSMPCYKITSYECTDFTILRKVAQTGKPVIMSTGFATLEEIEFAVSTLKKYGTKDIVLLHCVTAYSGDPKLQETNMRTMLDMKERFAVEVGFSDNNAGIEMPLVAAMAGASVIEKHFLIDRKENTPDNDFSINPNEFKEMVESIRRAEKIMGKVHFGSQSKAEEYNKRFRRSLFAVEKIKKGEKFSFENVRSIRPNLGLETKFYDQVIEKVAAQDIDRGTPLSWNLIVGGKS